MILFKENNTRLVRISISLLNLSGFLTLFLGMTLIALYYLTPFIVALRTYP
jgi:hypothetical protein